MVALVKVIPTLLIYIIIYGEQSVTHVVVPYYKVNPHGLCAVDRYGNRASQKLFAAAAK